MDCQTTGEHLVTSCVACLAALVLLVSMHALTVAGESMSVCGVPVHRALTALVGNCAR